MAGGGAVHGGRSQFKGSDRAEDHCPPLIRNIPDRWCTRYVDVLRLVLPGEEGRVTPWPPPPIHDRTVVIRQRRTQERVGHAEVALGIRAERARETTHLDAFCARSGGETKKQLFDARADISVEPLPALVTPQLDQPIHMVTDEQIGEEAEALEVGPSVALLELPRHVDVARVAVDRLDGRRLPAVRDIEALHVELPGEQDLREAGVGDVLQAQILKCGKFRDLGSCLSGQRQQRGNQRDAIKSRA